MNLLRVTVGIYLPPGARPTPAAIVTWFERALHAEEATIEHLGDTSFEFTTPLVQESQGWRTEASLQGLAAGILEVEEQPHGFDIVVAAQPRVWLLLLPLVAMGVLAGPMANVRFRILITAAGLALSGVAWLNGWIHLRALIRGISEDIMRSYATVPPRNPDHTLPASR